MSTDSIASTEKTEQDRVRTLCTHLISEAEVLQSIADEGHEKMVLVYQDLLEIIQTDSRMTNEMRQLILTTMARNPDEMFDILYVIIETIYRQDDAAFLPQDPSVPQQGKRTAFFYHINIDKNALAIAACIFQTHLAPKRILVQHLHEIKSQRGRHFALRLFNTLFGAKGEYTTLESAIFITRTTVMVENLTPEYCKKLDHLAYKAACKNYNPDAVRKADMMIRQMHAMCVGAEHGWPDHIILPWCCFRNMPDGKALIHRFIKLADVFLGTQKTPPPFLFELELVPRQNA